MSSVAVSWADEIELRRAERQRAFDRDLADLRRRLEEGNLTQSLLALDFAQPLHPGFRKDNATLSFHHQIRVALSLLDDEHRITSAGYNFDNIVAAGVLHDTPEDNPWVTRTTIIRSFKPEVADKILGDTADEKLRLTPEMMGLIFNPEIVRISFELNRAPDGKQLSDAAYYANLSPEAWIIKLHDRLDNVQTMTHLKPDRMARYYVETPQLLESASNAMVINPIVSNPALRSIAQFYSTQIEEYLNLYKDVVQAMHHGQAPAIVAAFAHEGLVETRRASLATFMGMGFVRSVKAILSKRPLPENKAA